MIQKALGGAMQVGMCACGIQKNLVLADSSGLSDLYQLI